MPKAILELEPCPFCGSPAELYGDCDMVWAVCTNDNCRAERITRFDEPEDAIEDWNMRSTSTVSVVQCKDCEHVIERDCDPEGHWYCLERECYTEADDYCSYGKKTKNINERNCRSQQNDCRRIDDLGRIAIPKLIRQILNISEGDELEFIVYSSAGGVFIKPTKKERDGNA